MPKICQEKKQLKKPFRTTPPPPLLGESLFNQIFQGAWKTADAVNFTLNLKPLNPAIQLPENMVLSYVFSGTVPKIAKDLGICLRISPDLKSLVGTGDSRPLPKAHPNLFFGWSQLILSNYINFIEILVCTSVIVFWVASSTSVKHRIPLALVFFPIQKTKVLRRSTGCCCCCCCCCCVLIAREFPFLGPDERYWNMVLSGMIEVGAISDQWELYKTYPLVN